MVVIHGGKKTYFMSSRLHLPHGVGEEEPITTFCQINYVNISGVKWKLKNATYLKFRCITDSVLLVRYRRNEWSQFVGVLIAK
jgi:CRISPR/Cas system CMR-associated protein Cmr3 (group 5 of RAMP superfamily)